MGAGVAGVDHSRGGVFRVVSGREWEPGWDARTGYQRTELRVSAPKHFELGGHMIIGQALREYGLMIIPARIDEASRRVWNATESCLELSCTG